MTNITIDQHIADLTAALQAATSMERAMRIHQELFLCELYAQTPEGRRKWEENPQIAKHP